MKEVLNKLIDELDADFRESGIEYELAQLDTMARDLLRIELAMELHGDSYE